jgi:hypothetical protein
VEKEEVEEYSSGEEGGTEQPVMSKSRVEERQRKLKCGEFHDCANAENVSPFSLDKVMQQHDIGRVMNPSPTYCYAASVISPSNKQVAEEKSLECPAYKCSVLGTRTQCTDVPSGQSEVQEEGNAAYGHNGA